MPAVAIVAAVAVDAGAAAAFAGGLAVTSTLGVLTAVTAIGATVSAIGAVTHDKTLSEVGMGLGIVGGIGTIATSAGLFGDAAANGADSIFGSSASDAAGAGAGAEAGAGGGVTVTDLPPAASDVTTSTGAINPSAVNPTEAIKSSVAPLEGNAAALETGGQTSTPLGQALSPTASAAAPNAALNTEVNAAAPPGMSPYNSGFLKEGLSEMAPAATPPSELMAWANKNPMMTWGAIQAGGSFITGLTNPLTPAQIDILNSQAEINRAAAALSERQMTNVGQGLPTVNGLTGQASPAGSLINNRPVVAAPVTGAPSTSLLSGAKVTGVPA